MLGTMLWFNEKKDLGSILTEEGERISVDGHHFTEGQRPLGRCAGLAVVFAVTGTEGERSATNVQLQPVVEQRRARAHHSAYRGRF